MFYKHQLSPVQYIQQPLLQGDYEGNFLLHLAELLPQNQDLIQPVVPYDEANY